jgi:hypothetical protein
VSEEGKDHGTVTWEIYAGSATVERLLLDWDDAMSRLADPTADDAAT